MITQQPTIGQNYSKNEDLVSVPFLNFGVKYDSSGHGILHKNGVPCPCLVIPPLPVANQKITGGMPDFLTTKHCSTMCPKANMYKNIAKKDHPQFNTDLAQGKTDEENKELLETVLSDRFLIYEVSCQGEPVMYAINDIIEEKPPMSKLVGIK